MNVEDLLSRLEKVRQTAPGEWVACCAAHDDRNPSLTIKDAGDGRILLHCFAGCETVAIMAMLGLNLSDLMPDKRLGPYNGLQATLRRIPFNPRTVLEAVAFNATAIAVAANDVAYGRRLAPKDADLVADMAREIHEAIAYATR